MSTMDVSCARCERKFRVRAEFAGRSTRCPGCSAPIAIGNAPRPATPAKPVEEDRPKPRSRPRDDDDDEPRQPPENWRPVGAAFQREQVAVIFALVGILGNFFSFCIVMASRGSGFMEPIVIFVVLLFAFAPALATTLFGVMARVAAISAPKESQARVSAKASLWCSAAGLACLVGSGLALLANFQSHDPNPLAMFVAGGGLILCGIASQMTFLGFIAQVGMARRSAALSRGVTRLTVAIAVCALVILGIGVLYTLVSELTSQPTYFGGGQYRSTYYYRDHSGFFAFVAGILMPLAFGVVLILYYRLLAAGRQAAKGEPAGRHDER